MRETGPEKPDEPSDKKPEAPQASDRYTDRLTESRRTAKTDGAGAPSDAADQVRESSAQADAERPPETERPPQAERPADANADGQDGDKAESRPERSGETDRPVEASPVDRRRSYADRLAHSREEAGSERPADAEPVPGESRPPEADRAAKSEGSDWRGDEGDQPRERGEQIERPAEPERPVDLPEGGEPLSEYPEMERQLRDNLERARQGVERWGPEDQQNAERWFGSSGPEVREHLDRVLGRIEAEVDRVRLMPFGEDLHPDDRSETFAYVHPGDTERRIYVGDLFGESGDVPPDSQAGILVHEMSHFKDIAGTGDVKGAYGVDGSLKLAIDNPHAARNTADNLEYFVEEYSVRGGPR